MHIIFDTQITVIWNYPSIVHSLTMNSYTSTIIPAPVFHKTIFSIMVLSQKLLGQCFVYLLPSMHGAYGTSVPYGPCIICLVTVSNARGSVSSSGSSAHIIRSMSSVHIGLSSLARVNNIWACGNPCLWNSITWICTHVTDEYRS